MKKSNNKGFSLVELIVVVAIMAVLVGVLAPAYLKYVEQSREKKDANNLEEVRHAVEIALADEDIYNEVKAAITTGTTTTFQIQDKTAIDTASAKLDTELATTVGTIDLVSTKYAGPHTVTIEINNGVVTVEGNWS